MSKKRKTVGTAYKQHIESITKNDPILTLNALSSKRIDPTYRKQYLEKIRGFFTIDELIKKWGSNKSTTCKFLIANRVKAFDGINTLEKELNDLITIFDLSNKGIRKRLVDVITTYNLRSLSSHYNIEVNELWFYLELFGISYTKNKDLIVNNTDNVDAPMTFSLIIEDDNIKRREINMGTTFETFTTVDMTSGLVLETNYIPVNKDTYISHNDVIKEKEELKTPISIITFLNYPEKLRKFKLNSLERLKNDEVEKILGIPSSTYYRKLKVRHMIFDFYNKDKLKNAFKRFTSFDECQTLVYDIIQNKRYDEFKVSEKTFKKFAEDYFDIFYSKINGLMFDDWNTFCKKITKQAIAVYKKNTRVTNLTEKEVLDFEAANRKVISTSDLIAITRAIIRDLYNDHQSWISIFDFKTEIEKNGFELDSNNRLIEIIDDLIQKKSFRSEFFTLKKITMENPVLSDDSSIRWEFVDLRKSEPVIKESVKEVNTIIPKSSINMVASADVKNVETKDTENIGIIEKKEDTENTNITNPINFNNFINSINLDISFDETNIDVVIDYIKSRIIEIGKGNISITAIKQ